MTEELEYHYWEKLSKKTKEALDQLDYEIELPELRTCYNRKIEIYDEILQDLSPQFDDPQYSGVVSWHYEKELKQLNENQESLETQYDLLVIQKEHQDHLNMLKEIGWTEQQYDDYQKELYSKPKPKINTAKTLNKKTKN